MLELLAWHKLTGSSDKATIAVSKVVFAGHVVETPEAHTWQGGWD